jgi:hypothetical protein
METLIMTKKNRYDSILLLVLGLAILSVLLAACQTDTNQAEASIGLRTDMADPATDTEPDRNTNSSIFTENNDGSAVDAVGEEAAGLAITTSSSAEEIPPAENAPVHLIDPAVTGELSAAEEEALIYMREEEKLARDVYLALYDLWGLPVFQNIAGSEQNHMDSVLSVLDAYGIADLAENHGAGEFSIPEFRSLYDQLLAQGQLSLADALRVGATIEELDIVDLNERVAQTDNETIVQIFSNLVAGSENHLRAFVSNLQNQIGEQYVPVYLDQSTFQAIMSDAGNGGLGNGRNGGGNGNGNRNGQGGNGQGGNGRRNG